MADVNPIPEGCEGVIPHLIVKGATAALEFYGKAFGAETVMAMPAPDGERVMHAEMRIGSSVVYVADSFPEYGPDRDPLVLGGSSVTIHQYVRDVDAAMARAAEAGAKVTMPATDMFWGDRYGMVADPFGHSWSFATHIADPTPEEMAAAAEAAFSGGPCDPQG